MYNKTRGSMRSATKAANAIRNGDYYYGGGKAYGDIPANFRIEPASLTYGDDGFTLRDIYGHVTGIFNVYSYRTIIGKIDTLNGTYWIDPYYASGYSVSTSHHIGCALSVARELDLKEV